MEPLRILIADDHPVFRDGLSLLLGTDQDVEVVDEVGTGTDAVTAAAERQPDVVVMDLHMPGTNGIEATRQIVATSPHVAVLVLTMLDDDDSVFAAMRAGAKGYLLKGSSQQEILRAVHAVGGGTAVFGPRIAQLVIDYFTGPQKPAAVPFPQLTDREREVLDLIAGGTNNAGIARGLHITPKTVRNHVSNIFAKLQVADRAQAIVRARNAGLG